MRLVERLTFIRWRIELTLRDHGFQDNSFIANWSIVVWFLTIVMLSAVASEGWAFKTPLEVPAIPSKLAISGLLQGVAQAGTRLVAVGVRGHIVVSDDGGKQWRQVAAPVSADLVAVTFPSPKQGWAVGHWGVVLHTTDGGDTWVKQLDGDQASELAIKFYEANPTKDSESALRKLKSQVTEKLSTALLDVYFENDNVGYVVGAFNRIFKTEDGGKTWTPWTDRVDNPQEFHLISIRGTPGHFFITGERGMVWRLDTTVQRFVASQTPYDGTLFGSVVDQSNIVAFGMRGNVLRSADDGKTWEKATISNDSGLKIEAGISAGSILADGRVVLFSQLGDVLTSTDHGATFRAFKLPNPKPYAGVTVIADKTVALVGPQGPAVAQLP